MTDIIPLPVSLEARELVADGYAVINKETGNVVTASGDYMSACEHALYLCMEADESGKYEVRAFRLLDD